MKRPLVYDRKGMLKLLDSGNLRSIHNYFNTYSDNLVIPNMRHPLQRHDYWTRKDRFPETYTEEDISYLRWIAKGRVKDNGEDE